MLNLIEIIPTKRCYFAVDQHLVLDLSVNRLQMYASFGSRGDLMENSIRLILAFAHMDFAPGLDLDALHNGCYECYWRYSIYHLHSPKNPCRTKHRILFSQFHVNLNLKDEKIGRKEGTRSGAEMKSKAKRKHRKVIWKVERKDQECWLVQKAYRFLIAVIDP